MAKLIQLPNGQWLDPRAVLGVQSMERQYGPGGSAPPRVIIAYPTGICAIDCETIQSANELRDKLAEQINEECL